MKPGLFIKEKLTLSGFFSILKFYIQQFQLPIFFAIAISLLLYHYIFIIKLISFVTIVTTRLF